MRLSKTKAPGSPLRRTDRPRAPRPWSAWPGSVAVRIAGLVLLCSWVGVDDARAVRGCTADPALSGRVCTEATCLALQADVTASCKSGNVSCNKISGCFNLRAMRQKWLDCYVARSRINTVCWAGGDLGHQQAAAQAMQNVSTCDARIALPTSAGGCADDCPLFLKSFEQVLREIEEETRAMAEAEAELFRLEQAAPGKGGGQGSNPGSDPGADTP